MKELIINVNVVVKKNLNIWMHMKDGNLMKKQKNKN